MTRRLSYFFLCLTTLGTCSPPLVANARWERFDDTAPALPSSDSVSPDKWRGSTREDILDAQQALGLKQDGVLGEKTKRMIKAFQEENSLPVTGWLDTSTMELLLDQAVDRKAPPVSEGSAAEQLDRL